MPRQPRSAPGGYVYHAYNNAIGRTKLFRKDADFAAFQEVLIEAQQRQRTRILSYCLMKTHWHLVIWPKKDGELSDFVRWVSHTHAVRMRWSGSGAPAYQGRFRSFPVQRDQHLLQVCRYVEQSPVREELVDRAQEWPWSSLSARLHGPKELRAILTDWPVERPGNWTSRLNALQPEEEVQRIETSNFRGRPYGDAAWTARTVKALGLESTVRPQGRPRRVLVDEEM